MNAWTVNTAPGILFFYRLWPNIPRPSCEIWSTKGCVYEILMPLIHLVSFLFTILSCGLWHLLNEGLFSCSPQVAYSSSPLVHSIMPPIRCSDSRRDLQMFWLAHMLSFFLWIYFLIWNHFPINWAYSRLRYILQRNHLHPENDILPMLESRIRCLWSIIDTIMSLADGAVATVAICFIFTLLALLALLGKFWSWWIMKLKLGLKDYSAILMMVNGFRMQSTERNSGTI